MRGFKASSFLLLLILDNTLAWDGCDHADWRCGDACIEKDTKCKCGEETFKKEDWLSKEVIETKDMQYKEISKKKHITQSKVNNNMQSKETSKDIMQAKETSEMNMHVKEEDMLLKQENLNVTNIKNLVVKIGNINQ